MVEEELFQRLRGGLSLAFPVLALPLGMLQWHDGPQPGTDGRWFYAPLSWLNGEGNTRSLRQKVLMHSLLHAMMGHPWGCGRRNQMRWDLACDLTVEFLSCRMAGKPMEGVVGRAYYACDSRWAFSAKALYDALERGFPVPEEELWPLVHLDSHEMWKRISAQTCCTPAQEGEDLAAQWRREKEKLRPYCQTDRPKIGTGTQNQKLDVGTITDYPVKFGDLLRQFSQVRENCHVNDADFAYSWYAYGVEHYNGMPLLEPLEYSEERKLWEMAIVLDTSASCSRGLVSRFLGAVHSALCKEQLFFHRFRLYLIQCDCQVQQKSLITNLDEFQWYLEHLELFGGGGTDYRPAFEEIDRLVACGELPRLGGVLYFTDGYGVFPAQPPPYPTAFVMLQYRYDDINIPDWAIKLVLDAEKPGRDEGWI